MNDQLHTAPQGEPASERSRWRQQHADPAQESTFEGDAVTPTAFDQFLEAVTRQMQPEGRAQHQAGMHRYLRTLLPAGVTLADLVAGWRLLAEPRPDANSAVLSRRKTCAELAAIAAPFAREPGQLTRAVSAWQAWRDASQNSADPRLAAMGATFARELMELQSAA